MSYQSKASNYLICKSALLVAAFLVAGTTIAADPGEELGRQRTPAKKLLNRELIDRMVDQGLSSYEVNQQLRALGYDVPEMTAPPTRSGEAIDIQAQIDRPDKGMDKDTINTWTAIEEALRVDDWDRVKVLVRQLPDWRSHEGVERLLARAPRDLPESRPGKAMSAEEHEAISREIIRQAVEHDAATRPLQFAPTDEDVVLGSTEGRQPRPFTDIRPPSAPTGEKAPEAVLTVGDSCTYPTIQAAINAAVSGDTLWIQGKVFFESNYIISKNLALWGGLDAACLGLDGSRTVVDASTIGYNDTVMEIEGATASTVVIHIMDFINGTNDANFGGGLEISAAAHDVTLDDVDIYNNVSDYGGGVHMTDGSSLYLTNGSRIGNNSSIDGAGIYAVGPSTFVYVDASYVGSAVLGGNVASSSGGGVYLMDAILYVGATDTWGYIYQNSANIGGGVYATGTSTVNLDHSGAVISDNFATSGGGGVYLADPASLWNDSGGIVDNVSDYDGGGVFSATTAYLDSDDGGICDGLVCARISRNYANNGGYGGGIAVWAATVLDLQSTWVQNNTSSSLGSAVYASGAGAVILRSVMVTENHSDSVGGTMRLHYTAGMTIHNSTFADNTGNGTIQVLSGDGGDITSQGLIFWGNDGTAPTSGTNTYAISESIDQFGVVGSNVDPLFFNAAADNYHIQPTSPAVDAATGVHYQDIDAETRPLGSSEDIGADEAYARVGINGAPCFYPDISSAIAAASAGDTIYIPPGWYVERLDFGIDLSFIQSTGDCTGVGSGTIGDVIIDGNDVTTTWGGVAMVNNAVTADFTNMTLYNGTATYGGVMWTAIGSVVNLTDVYLGWGVADSYGGGGALINGVLNLYGDTIVYSNSVSGTGAGGAIWVNSNGTLNLYENSLIGYAGSPNISPTDGGGVYVTGGSSVTMNDNSEIRNNQTSSDDGGGIFLTGVGSSLTVNDLAYINANTAFDDGGGVALEDGASMTMNDSSWVLDNLASSGAGWGAGGGIYIQNAATNPVSVTINGNGGVANNDAAQGGGGVWLQVDSGSSTVTFNGSMLAYNSAPDYGGGYFSAAADSVLVLQNGASVDGNTAFANQGGGIYLSNGALDMDDSSIVNNIADFNGGGIYNSGGTVDIRATGGPAAVSHNQSVVGSGGGLYDASGNIIILWAISGFPLDIDTNIAGADGGGIFVTNGAFLDTWGDLQVTNNTAALHGGGVYQSNGDGIFDEAGGARPLIADNEATGGNGGGVYLSNVNNPGLFYFAQAVVSGNSAPAGSGGGIYADASLFGLYNTIVGNNSSGSFGGGMAIGSGSDATIYAALVAPTAAHAGGHEAPLATACDPSALPPDRYCTEFFTNAASAYGGALFLNGGSTMTVSNTALIDNSASLGSGVYSQHAGDTLTMTNCRVSDNGGSTGVRMYDAGTLTLDSTTIAGNVGPGVDIDDPGAVVTFNSNIVWGNTSGVWTGGATVGGNGCNIDQAGVAGIMADPLFTATARGSYHLGAGSPAVDVCASGQPIDLDNIARPVGANFDMGAFEASSGTFTGVVDLQPVRASTAGVTVVAFDAGTSNLVASTTTDAAGNYALDVPPGNYDVVADLNLYLSAKYFNAAVGAGGTLALPNVTLRGGDHDDSGAVVLLDVTYVASRFGMAGQPQADINASGTVDIVDVSATASNFGTVQPTPWP